MGNPLRHTGPASDSTSGLTYARARWYDAATGRFLQTDPMGGGYAYAGDDPIGPVDSSGMSPRPPSHHARCPVGYCSSMTPSSSVPGATVTTSSTVLQFSWDRCGTGVAVFMLGILLGAVGLSLSALGPDAIALFTTRISMFYNFIADFGAISRSPGDPMSWVTALIDIGMGFWWTILIPNLGFWSALEVGASLTADSSGWGFLIQLANFIFDIILGFGDLLMQHCVPFITYT